MVGYCPTISYGEGTSVYCNVDTNTNTITDGNVTTGGIQYRIQQWPTATSNTYPANNWANSTAASTVIEMQYSEYATLDMPTTWRYEPTGGYTLRVYRGGADTVTYTYGNTALWLSPQKSAAERLKDILHHRMAPGVLTNRVPLGYASDVREQRARETLRRVLGEDKFKDFVRRGSVSVRAKSGLMYQIFPGSAFTNVYDSGKLTERLCVVLQGGFPPTDSLIMRYLMILNNEQQFRGYAIKHGIQTPVLAQQPDQRSLTEIFKELKKVA